LKKSEGDIMSKSGRIPAVIYTNLDLAIEAGEKFLSSAPDLSFIFETNATGGLDIFPAREGAKQLVDKMNDACGGFSFSSINEAMPQIEQLAIEMGRSVSRYKQGDLYFTEISPTRN
jgi:hypothetical protein